ncbi:Reverse transcriptase (RNA-dependent DNA polymerase) [Salipiger marinus]|uniref:RNA-directed DNA polymerase n=2 Tax=Salipiger marinus TaxID=555512 RepID=A0A1G8LMJ6_9RHOB|nr:Reverse transcriptase (RNA-dependent DNA polymerase) [Salipiger marinus]
MPITSKEVLATMFGVNPGIVWSFINKPDRHYRKFSIPKGKGKRSILAPKVGLKVIQKWISYQLQGKARFPDHVFGFVPGRSHIDAAVRHTSARWVYSIDLEDFFPSTPRSLIASSLCSFGYDFKSSELISKLSCYDGGLAQGAPSSPVLSNIAMFEVDTALAELAEELGIRITRYADDITFSSEGVYPSSLPERLSTIFYSTPWKISKKKTYFSVAPKRMKVHGLIVNCGEVKLTKGYRNKLRAYRHVLQSGLCKKEDACRLEGHLNYYSQVIKHRDSST